LIIEDLEENEEEVKEISRKDKIVNYLKESSLFLFHKDCILRQKLLSLLSVENGDRLGL
jgi:hypothetical protein